ncbi:putative cytoplasmic protein [Alkalidesulfovibrio alkalitolerans DSM 16529]|jgi:hypothetical protein|uniref:Putative cytoplasmic protein n=1 Tax=Alkalidesulfovibrio alkalitolerans DSM 16529 TaxID=1121439 RepID=S7TFR6_9BACT|nr:hypothetical protein [Alkalidesulfovibrio alkalitolerans]EPR35586.1 putative cytoplasmic protein [Alkalidesulfovibrio alkalitolerans DSM 16529]
MNEFVDIARAERETLRWVLLYALWHARPYGTTEMVLMRTAQDVPLAVTPDLVRQELASLEKRGLLTISKGPVWKAELTADGEDVVDHRAPCPAGVARPPKW